MCKIQTLLLFLIISVNLSSYAQDNGLQLPLKQLAAAKRDTGKVILYNKISGLYTNVNADSALIYADYALNLAQKLKFKKGLALALLSKGSALEPKGNYTEALSCYLRALTISQQLKMPMLINSIYNDIGIVYLHMENYPYALKYFTKVLNYINGQKTQDKAFQFKILVNIGEVFRETKHLDSAILYNMNALSIAEKNKDDIGRAITLFNIADNFILKKQYSKAISYLNLSLPISEKIGDLEGVSGCLNAFSRIYYQTKHYQQSIDAANKSLAKGKAVDNYQNTLDSYNLLYLNYKNIGDFEKALTFRNLEISLDDRVNTLEQDKQLQRIQSDYLLKQKQNEINLLRKEGIVHRKIIQSEKYARFFALAFTLILLLFIVQLYRGNANKKALNNQLNLNNLAVKHQNQELEKLNETKNVLFSIIGHDLRGPFAYLLSMIDLMKNKEISLDEQEYFLTKLSENIHVTDHLLNNLLFWAKSQMEGMVVNKAAFDVQPIITENINLLKSRGDNKGIQIMQRGTAQPVLVYADKAMLDLVVRNLLENAMKFSKDGDTIKVDVSIDHTLVVIAIIDSGMGIRLQDQSKIFSKVSSFTTYGTSNEKGSGLGLLLCKELIEKNDGKIWFESTPGTGSTFYISIPKTV